MHIGFKALKAKIAAHGGVSDPGAVAASIGRKKYGAKKMAQMSAAGRKKSHMGYVHHGKGTGPKSPCHTCD